MRVREVKPSQPPTAWSSSRASGISTLSLAPSVRSHASDSSSGRSVSSYGGRRSERTPSLDHIRELDAESFRDETGMATPSSVSSSSVAMPLTPVGDEDAGSWSYSTGPALSATPSVARRIPSRFNLKTPSSKTASASESLPFPRERTQSASSNGSANASVGHIPPPSAPRQASIPRPLRLPQATGLRPTGSQSNMRQPSTRTPSATSTLSTPQPDRGRSVSTAAAKTSLPSYSASPLRLARPPALSDPPSPSPVSPSDRKPRIGAGMVYRTGSASSRPSMMRAPNPATLRPVAAKV
ncbi:uncharacterized protein PHACADRAFT_194364 [Phanerochaete carnosa HHB-10118-sp]|uniref:Uncharacterized protein n=1 Tax=Phanerochaete carnosa (strain HHB-10118-sp) TaxID=650164 RepID=K5WC41_PHACS|nr:uncharacterized protein PHACADRAFT_194364 [Phanerochaete carnosa HHB-10118-sp]EKM56775.1 hypothetical protein PHACADRAFT_194364 [Phanerochaete carnosa HHB-10118-sp]